MDSVNILIGSFIKYFIGFKILNEQMIKKISPNMLANMVTLFRVAVIPYFIMVEIQGRYFQSLIVMMLVCMSDMIDGTIARIADANNKTGKAFDITADFIFIMSIFLFWHIYQEVSLHILFLLLFSFLSFIFLSLLKKKIVKNKIGQYVGTACFAGILFILFGRIYFPEWIIEIKSIVYAVINIFLILSIFENILNIKKFYS